MVVNSRQCHELPRFTEKLLLIADVALVTDSQVLQSQLGIFFVRRSDGALVGLKLDNIYCFVRRN